MDGKNLANFLVKFIVRSAAVGDLGVDAYSHAVSYLTLYMVDVESIRCLTESTSKSTL